MNLAHLHLLLNHVPIIGTIVGLGLFLVSLVGKSEELKRASLGVFCFVALLAIPAFQSGNAAQQAIQSLPGVSGTLIQAHQDSALLAFAFMEITGAVAWLGMWRSRRISRPAPWNVSAVLLLSIVTVGLMARTGNNGGEIRHPEIRSAQEATSPDTTATDGTAGSRTEWLKAASFRPFTNGHSWAWPALETLHFIGLCLLFGVLLIVNLRMLGTMKSVSFAALHRLLPWGILGFGVNAITGMIFFIATPEQYTQNVAFYWKMALMLLAGVNVLYLTVVDEAWALGPGDDAPLTGKMIAASGIFLWVGVMYFGRMLPYIGNSF